MSACFPGKCHYMYEYDGRGSGGTAFFPQFNVPCYWCTLFQNQICTQTQTRFNVQFWHELCFRLAECGEFSQKRAHSNPFCQQRQQKLKRGCIILHQNTLIIKSAPHMEHQTLFIRKLEQLNLFPTRIISSSNTTLRTESIYYSQGMEPC